MNKTIAAIKSIINLTLGAPFEQVSQMSELIDGLGDDIQTIQSILPSAPFSGAYVAEESQTTPAVESEVVPKMLYPSEAEGKVEPLTSTEVVEAPTERSKHKYHKTEALLIIDIVGGLGLKWYPVDSLVPKIKKSYPDMDAKIIRQVLRQQTFKKLSDPVWQYSETGDKILKKDRGVTK